MRLRGAGATFIVCCALLARSAGAAPGEAAPPAIGGEAALQVWAPLGLGLLLRAHGALPGEPVRWLAGGFAMVGGSGGGALGATLGVGWRPGWRFRVDLAAEAGVGSFDFSGSHLSTSDGPSRSSGAGAFGPADSQARAFLGGRAGLTLLEERQGVGWLLGLSFAIGAAGRCSSEGPGCLFDRGQAYANGALAIGLTFH